jgi:hypothetical protein
MMAQEVAQRARDPAAVGISSLPARLLRPDADGSGADRGRVVRQQAEELTTERARRQTSSPAPGRSNSMESQA